MNGLSPEIYEQALKVSALLRAAEKPVRILKTLSWHPSVKADFLAAHEQKMPAPEYPKFDAGPSLSYIADARKNLEGDHPVLQWLSRTADTLELAAHMMTHMGTASFYDFSKRIYGHPEKLLLDGKNRTIDLARHLDETLSGYSFENLVLGGKVEYLSASEFSQKLFGKLERYFGSLAPKLKITPNLSAKAVAGRTRIRIREGAQFTAMDVRQLLHHEALVHSATAINGRAQENFAILGAAHAGTTEIQEGIAVFAEIITGAMDPMRFHRLVDRVIAIQMAIDGADFIEVFRYFNGQDQDDDQAFENTRRVFRGGVLSGGAPFTKDGVYLNGLLRVHNYLRTVIKLGRADLIRLLFVGKLDLEDIPALASLAESGYLTPPRILPPWVKDMRFLLSYLAYSSFLNRVKLPGFQSYYKNMLEDVPDVWAFNNAAS